MGRFLFAVCALGCGGVAAVDAGMVDAGSIDVDAGRDAGSPSSLPDTIGPSDRPARFVAPSAHDGVTALPAIVLLHGYTASGSLQDTYLRFSAATRTSGFYVVIPDGTQSSSGARFWNATPACCDFENSGVDDVAYLTGLLDELEALVPVSAIYFFGHSNGGFMSYRMACERSDRIDAIVSLAGSDYPNETDCVPDQPVSVLQIHGDRDSTIQYGGTLGYPPAREVVERWAARAGCDTTPVIGTPLDLESTLAGAETTVDVYATGCDGNASAELWTIVNGGHIPSTTADFMPAVLAWMSSHAR